MKDREKKTRAKQTTLKVLTAVAAAFLKDKHGLMLEVENEKWLIHKALGRIYIDSANDFENFEHGLLVKLKEDEEGHFEPEKPTEEGPCVIELND